LKPHAYKQAEINGKRYNTTRNDGWVGLELRMMGTRSDAVRERLASRRARGARAIQNQSQSHGHFETITVLITASMQKRKSLYF
jgi:hypothetical protein